MRDIVTDREYWIDGDELVPVVTKSTPLEGELEIWNLRSLVMLITADKIRDDTFRKEVLARIKRARRAAGGAVFGGFIDALSGDEGILDGVLLGAAFGALSPVGLDDPKATVGLLFSDGSYLVAEVDRCEYELLQARVASNAARLDGVEHPARKRRPLTVAEQKAVIELKKEPLALLGTVLALFCMLETALVSGLDVSVFIPFVEEPVPFTKLAPFFYLPGYIAFVAFVIWFLWPPLAPRKGGQAAGGAEARRGGRPG